MRGEISSPPFSLVVRPVTSTGDKGPVPVLGVGRSPVLPAPWAPGLRYVWSGGEVTCWLFCRLSLVWWLSHLEQHAVAWYHLASNPPTGLWFSLHPQAPCTQRGLPGHTLSPPPWLICCQRPVHLLHCISQNLLLSSWFTCEPREGGALFKGLLWPWPGTYSTTVIWIE